MQNLEIDERIAALSPEKRELLLQKLREKPKKKAENIVPQLTSEPREDLHQPFKLSEIQQAYWLGQSGLFDLGAQGSNIFMEYEITGVNLLTKRLLQWRMNNALEKLIKHYDMLRVSIRSNGLQQILTDVLPYRIKIIDFRGKDLKFVERELAVTRERLKLKKTRVDEWPLFEFLGYHLDGKRLILQIRVSALIMDGTSRGKFISHFMQLVTNPFKKLSPLEISYRDYVLAWDEFKTGPVYQRARDNWLKRLPDLLPGPRLPLKEYLEPKAPSQLEAWEIELVTASVWEKIQSRAKQSGLSPSSVLLAAFIDTLAYWSFTPQFSIGIIHTYRPPLHPKIKDILGNFNSIGIVQADVLGGNFIERAKKLQWQVLEIVDSPYYSGLEVLREINRVHARSSKATIPVFFNSLLNYIEKERQPEKTEQLASAKEKTVGKSLLPRFTEREITLYPTQVQLFPTIYETDNGGINCKWEVANRLFPTDMMNKMVAGYQNLLKKLAIDERSWLKNWGETTKVFPTIEKKLITNNDLLPKTEMTISSLLAQSMCKHSQKIAVISHDKQLTYGELTQLVAQLRQRLENSGVKPGHRLVLMMEKSWEAIVTLLGILQLGANYIPVGQTIRQEEFNDLLSQHEVKLVLKSSTYKNLSLPEDVQSITVDEDLFHCSAKPTSTVTDWVNNEVACIIYPNGYHDRFKWVKLNHVKIVELLLDLNQRFQITPEDKFLSQYPTTSSLWLYDILGALTAGAEVVLPTVGEEKWSQEQWFQLIQKEQITIWSSAPERWENFLTLIEEKTDFQQWSLRLIVLSNGSIPRGLVERTCLLNQDTQIYHLWGTDDALLWTMACKLDRLQDHGGARFNQVITGQQIYLLNSAFQKAPEWVLGSVYIGGQGLLAYDGSQKFSIPHPETGELLTKTGYIGRYINQEFVEILGTEESFQFFSHGYSVYPIEVQDHLERHPDVRYALVRVEEDTKCIKYLQAWVAKYKGSMLEINSLREFLRQSLPDYAIPRDLLWIEEQPKKESPNHRIERLRPQTELEENLLRIWEQLLQKKPIRITDNFFDLGGDSLKAFQLYTLMQNELRIQLPPAKFFQELTIKNLASLL